MAINFDKDKIKAAGTEVVTTTSATSTAEEKKTDSKQAVKMEGQYYSPTTPQTTEPTKHQQEEATAARQRSAEANNAAIEETKNTKAAAMAMAQSTEESDNIKLEAALKDDITTIEDQDKKDSAQSVTDTEKGAYEKSEEASNYANILKQKNKTIYQKTSQILDEYIKNHPEEYPQYAKMDEVQKKKFRDTEMGKTFRKLVGKQNLTKAERKTATRDLAILLTSVEAKGLSLKKLSDNPNEMKQLIAQGDKQLYQHMLSKIDTKNPDKALNDIAELYLTFTDPNYLMLEGKEKDKYLKTRQAKLFNIIGVNDPKKIPEQAKENAANILVGVLSELGKDDLTIKDLVNMPTKRQTEFLVNAIEKYAKEHPEVIERLQPETKQAWQLLKSRDRLMQEIDKENPTERDLYNKLLEKEKSGKLTAEEKYMLDSYKMMDEISKKKGKDYLKTEAGMNSNVVKIIATGMSYEAQFYDRLKDAKDPKEIEKIVNEIAEGMSNDFDKTIQLKALYSTIKDLGYKPEDIIKLIPKEQLEMISAGIISNPDKEQATLGTDTIAKFNNSVMDETVDTAVSILPAHRSPEWLKYYGSEVKTTKYDKAFSTGINENLDTNTAREIFLYIATNATTDEKKSSIVEHSLTTTNDSTRIKAYTESYKTIKSPAVTEGMAAAAHNTTDSNNKNIINSGVDYAIKNNGYTSEQKANIEQARQTGQTSYERTSSSSSSSSNNASGKASSTAAKTSSNTTPSTGKASTGHTTITASSPSTGSSSGSAQKTTTSGSTSTYVAFGSTNYGDQVTKALADKKTRTQERITQIIDNYQKTTKAQDSKVEKQADTTSKEAASQAAKAAEKEAKVVKTFVESPQASGNIDAKTIQELKTAYSSGGMTGLYEKLGTLGETVQEKFLSFFAKYSDGNSLHSFASSFSNNKSIILSLYQYSNDPSLLAYLGESATRDLLSKGKIKMKDFLKYASPSAIALYISDLNKTGNQELLKQIFGLLNLSQTSYVKQHTSKPAPGGDDWMAQLQNNMSKASGFELSDGLAMGSDRAPMGRSYDKMKQRGPFYFSA